MGLLHRRTEVELPLCVLFNRASRSRRIHDGFAIVSRLADGALWYTIIASLPLIYGMEALEASLHTLAVGLVSLVIYKSLKRHTSRARPDRINPDILHTVRALDEFSFPSRHTLHAVGFTVVLLSNYPEWWSIVPPFTTLVAASRLVLGLHYPSDVLIGAVIGPSAGLLSLPIF